MEFAHTSIMLNEVIEGLNIRPEGIYVDGTLGGAGHSYHICEKLKGSGKLVGIDQDSDAISAAKKRLEIFRDRVEIKKNNYVNIKSVLKELGINKVDGILLDLGVSSYQFDNFERGFSYREDAPLDMRMDRDGNLSAADVLNTYSEEEIADILWKYGEEKFSRRIAANIVKERKNHKIETTFQFVDIIKKSMPAKAKNSKGHPAKKSFQAIRIECNKELEVLENALDEMVDLLSDGGRLCIITFHSLEDRIVKNKFREFSNPCTCPPDFPVCVCGKKSKGKIITRKPIVPSREEQILNPRSKSSKLRIFEKGIL